MEYSVLTYIVGDYEHPHEIAEKSERAEYILVTDNRSITSSTWTVVYVDNPHPEDPFYLCYQIRFNPFDYVHTDTVVRIDGSMGIVGSLDPVIDKFDEGGYDILLCIHPTRSDLYSEYMTWVNRRGYPESQARRILDFIGKGYDVKAKNGLYQYGFMIQRKNEKNTLLNSVTLDHLLKLAPEGKWIERIDQTIGSYLLNRYFSDMKVLAIDEDFFNGNIIRLYSHGTDKPISCGRSSNPILFGKKIKTWCFL